MPVKIHASCNVPSVSRRMFAARLYIKRPTCSFSRHTTRKGMHKRGPCWPALIDSRGHGDLAEKTWSETRRRIYMSFKSRGANVRHASVIANCTCESHSIPRGRKCLSIKRVAFIFTTTSVHRRLCSYRVVFVILILASAHWEREILTRHISCFRTKFLNNITR